MLCEEAEEACAILQLCVENLSFRVTKQTEPKRENIQEKATKKEKENQIVVECSSKIKYPVSWAASIEVCAHFTPVKYDFLLIFVTYINFIHTATVAILC